MRKTFIAGCWILTFGFLLSAYSPAQIERSKTDQERQKDAGPSGGGALITVLNPEVSNKMAERLPLSPRLDTLEGKTIYMVDINWGGPEASLHVFEEIQAWFNRNRPGVKTVIKIKRGGYDADDPALWKEISDNKGDAVILGISA